MPVWSGVARISALSMISSVVRMTRFAARTICGARNLAATLCRLVSPNWALPNLSARGTWISATSGTTAVTASSSLPSKGEGNVRHSGWCGRWSLK